MLPETTEVVVRETLPKCPRDMAEHPVGAQDGESFPTHNMTALAFTTSTASPQGGAQLSPQPLQKTLPQQTTGSQQTKEGGSSVLEEHSHPKPRMGVQKEEDQEERPLCPDAFFRELGLKRKGSADTAMVDASLNEQSIVSSSAESGSMEQKQDNDLDMEDLPTEENVTKKYPITLQAASPTASRISTSGKRRTKSLPGYRLYWDDRRGLVCREEPGNAMRDVDCIVIDDDSEEEEEVPERVASPVQTNDGLEVAKEKHKKEDGKTKSDEDRLKQVVKKIPISSPLFHVPQLKPLHHITTTAENNIIRSYDEYCKSNSGEKLRARLFPCSWKRQEPSWCHKYKFNRAHRQEFRRVLATGLNKRSRALLQNCKRCCVALKRLTTEDINKWKTRVVRKEIHYDDDLIMIVDEVITPNSTSEVNPLQSQTTLSNHLADSTVQPTPFLQRPPLGLKKHGCQVMRQLPGQIRGFSGPRSAKLLLNRNFRKVVMKPKEVEKTFKGKEAGGIVRKTVYTPCQGEVSSPIRSRGSHIPNILLPGVSTPHRTSPLAPKKSLPTLHPKPFASIPNPTRHLVSQPQPNSQPHRSSQQHPTSFLVPCGQAFDDQSNVLQPTYLNPQLRTQNDMDELLRQYNIIGSVQNQSDNQVADVTHMPHADTNLVYLQASPDVAVQYVNMPVSSMSFTPRISLYPLSFQNVGFPGEPPTLGVLTPTSEVGDFSQNLDRQEASDGRVVSTTLPQETSINLDPDDEVIIVIDSDDDSK